MSPEQLALLVKNEWQLSYVTPLYQFRHTQLKSYSRQLSAFIAAEKQQGLAVEVEGPQNLKISFSVVEGMVESADDAETVLIQVEESPIAFHLSSRNMARCFLCVPCGFFWSQLTLSIASYQEAGAPLAILGPMLPPILRG